MACLVVRGKQRRGHVYDPWVKRELDLGHAALSPMREGSFAGPAP